MILKKFLLFASMLMMLACSSNSDRKNGSGGDATDPLSGFNINTMITKTVLDSVPFARLPYCDSICVASSLPLRQIHVSAGNIEFLKIKKLREFSDNYDGLPDSLFTLVCRVDVSPSFYSLIINFNNMSETMNYMINYDRDFRVIDYIETCFEQTADCSTRITSVIDTGSITMYHSNILSPPEENKVFFYSISRDGFFREMPDKLTANGN